MAVSFCNRHAEILGQVSPSDSANVRKPEKEGFWVLHAVSEAIGAKNTGCLGNSQDRVDLLLVTEYTQSGRTRGRYMGDQQFGAEITELLDEPREQTAHYGLAHAGAQNY